MKRVLAVSLLMIAAATIAVGQCSDADKQKLEAFDRAWGEAGVRGDRAARADSRDELRQIPQRRLIPDVLFVRELATRPGAP